jgi:hypothetical protein
MIILDKPLSLLTREHPGRLSGDLAKAQEYHEAARELALEPNDRNPKFTDKEKLNLGNLRRTAGRSYSKTAVLGNGARRRRFKRIRGFSVSEPLMSKW